LNKAGTVTIILAELELGAEKDTLKMNHGDGKNADATMTIIPFMEQEMADSHPGP